MEKTMQQHLEHLASEIKAIQEWAEGAVGHTYGYVESEVYYRVRKLNEYAKEYNIPFMADAYEITKQLDYYDYEPEESSSYYEEESSYYEEEEESSWD